MTTRPGIDQAYAFDPNDPDAAKDFARLAVIRREKPVCRPADNIVLVTRYADAVEVFRDSKGFSSVGDMRAPGIVVPTEESFLGELDAPLHPKIRRVLHRTFTIAKAQESADFTRRSREAAARGDRGERQGRPDERSRDSDPGLGVGRSARASRRRSTIR